MVDKTFGEKVQMSYLNMSPLKTLFLPVPVPDLIV